MTEIRRRRGIVMRRTVLLVTMAAMATTCAPALAINKCAGPDGKVVFQDTPCAPGKGGEIDVRPASGRSSVVAPVQPREAGSTSNTGGAAPPPTMTEAQRIEAQISASQRERRKSELDVLLVPNARQKISALRANCNRQLAGLRAQKAQANNNLAGATWEGSISSEMIAVSTRCDTESRMAKDELDELLAECRSLDGCRN